MNFMYIFKVLIISLFIFLIVFTINFVGTSYTYVEANHSNIKNAIKQSINIGELRVNNTISFDEETLINEVLSNYVEENTELSDEITFNISQYENTITVEIIKIKDILNNESIVQGIFSYEVLEK